MRVKVPAWDLLFNQAPFRAHIVENSVQSLQLLKVPVLVRNPRIHVVDPLLPNLDLFPPVPHTFSTIWIFFSNFSPQKPHKTLSADFPPCLNQKNTYFPHYFFCF